MFENHSPHPPPEPVVATDIRSVSKYRSPETSDDDVNNGPTNQRRVPLRRQLLCLTNDFVELLPVVSEPTVKTSNVTNVSNGRTVSFGRRVETFLNCLYGQANGECRNRNGAYKKSTVRQGLGFKRFSRKVLRLKIGL